MTVPEAPAANPDVCSVHDASDRCHRARGWCYTAATQRRFSLTHALIVLLVAVVLAEVSAIATSIYLHRALAHRALHVHPALDVLFRTLLWMTTGQNRREWVAVHRKHHTFTDRAGDPH